MGLHEAEPTPMRTTTRRSPHLPINSALSPLRTDVATPLDWTPGARVLRNREAPPSESSWFEQALNVLARRPARGGDAPADGKDGAPGATGATHTLEQEAVSSRGQGCSCAQLESAALLAEPTQLAAEGIFAHSAAGASMLPSSDGQQGLSSSAARQHELRVILCPPLGMLLLACVEI